MMRWRAASTEIYYTCTSTSIQILRSIFYRYSGELFIHCCTMNMTVFFKRRALCCLSLVLSYFYIFKAWLSRSTEIRRCLWRSQPHSTMHSTLSRCCCCLHSKHKYSYYMCMMRFSIFAHFRFPIYDTGMYDTAAVQLVSCMTWMDGETFWPRCIGCFTGHHCSSGCVTRKEDREEDNALKSFCIYYVTAVSVLLLLLQ